MELGAFSISLAVKDLERSIAFYEKLGFEVSGGDRTGYVIMANGTSLIGLFHGMFEGNILTFNPGLTNEKEMLIRFTDIRELQDSLKTSGVELTTEASGDGPSSFTLVDPDGNAILVDQFFPRPEK